MGHRGRNVFTHTGRTRRARQVIEKIVIDFNYAVTKEVDIYSCRVKTKKNKLAHNNAAINTFVRCENDYVIESWHSAVVF